MMRQLSLGIAIVIVVMSAAIASSYALARSMDDIVFPVGELGGCKSEAACKVYCDAPGHLQACLTFAEKHNLMSSEELRMARKFAAAGAKGPGGCTSRRSCDSYCDDVSHIDECLDFAERNGLIPPSELEEGRKVQSALKKGAKLPGGCRSKEGCDQYCGEPGHMEECIVFAEAAGFIPDDELEEARKVLQAVKKGARPPPCRGKQECDRYCTEPAHMEACLTFAEAAGLIPEGELDDAKKALRAIKKGVKPPNCRGRAACDAYCSEPAHLDECLTFAEAAGFISPEDAAMARKTGGKGPGGCRGKEECERFCVNPMNMMTCFQFAKEHGLLSEEELEEAEEGLARTLEAFEEAPPEVMDCITSAVGSETVEGIRAGTRMPTPEMGDTMRRCFEEMQSPPEEGSMEPPDDSSEDFFDENFLEEEGGNLVEGVKRFFKSILRFFGGA